MSKEELIEYYDSQLEMIAARNGRFIEIQGKRLFQPLSIQDLMILAEKKKIKPNPEAGEYWKKDLCNKLIMAGL